LLKKQPTGDRQIIVAQLNPRTHARTLRTPGPSPRDSDDVLVALETAHALEVRGDMLEAARWLRRAANEAEKQGNDTRVLALAHAAADLTSASAQAPVTQAPVAHAPPRLGRQREPHDSEPTLHWRVTPPPLPTRASSLPAPSKANSFIRERAIPAGQPAPERQMRMGAIRVAIKQPTPAARSFTVERLDADQSLPPGAVEGLLVLARDVDEPTD
jgi:hypothetical protein